MTWPGVSVRAIALLHLLGGCGDDGVVPADEGTTDASASASSASGSTTDGSATESDGDGSSTADPCELPDSDGDGEDAIACGGEDCDDMDRQVYPGAPDGWIHSVVLGPLDQPPGSSSFAIDSGGTLHAVYLAPDAGSFQHATSADGSAWEVELVGVDGDILARGIDLAAGADGSLHVLLSEQSETVVYGSFDGQWSFEVVEELGFPAAITYGDGEVVMASGSGQIARGGPGTWTFENAGTSGNARTIDVAAGPDGAIHTLVYNFDAGIGANVGVLHATDASGEWVVTRLHPQTYDTVSVAVAFAGDAPNLFVQTTNSSLIRLLRHTPEGDDWAEETLRTFGSGSTGIAAASGDPVPVVAYHHTPSGDTAGLEVAELDGEWSFARVVTDDHSGHQPRVALADDGTVHVVYLEVGPTTLWHARRGSDGVDQNCDGMD